MGYTINLNWWIPDFCIINRKSHGRLLWLFCVFCLWKCSYKLSLEMQVWKETLWNKWDQTRRFKTSYHWHRIHVLYLICLNNFTYIYHKNQPKVGKYVYIYSTEPIYIYIHGSYGIGTFEKQKPKLCELEPLTKPPALRMPKKDSERFDVKVSLTQQPVDETEKAM